MALTTEADILLAAKRRYINPDATRWDTTAIESAIASAQKLIEDETGYIFDEQEFTQTLSGYELGGGYTLLLDKYPIVEITTLAIEGFSLDEDDDFFITDPSIGKIGFEVTLPESGYNNVEIEGVCGYSPAHPTAKALCEDIVLYQILTNRETPPHLKTMLRSSSSTNNLTLKSDDDSGLVDLVFDIQTRLAQLPHRTFIEVI
jgi:hypothetical protein